MGGSRGSARGGQAARPLGKTAHGGQPFSPSRISWLASNLSPRCSGWLYEPEDPAAARLFNCIVPANLNLPLSFDVASHLGAGLEVRGIETLAASAAEPCAAPSHPPSNSFQPRQKRLKKFLVLPSYELPKQRNGECIFAVAVFVYQSRMSKRREHLIHMACAKWFVG